MSREEALPKLLALGPMRFGELQSVCGWPTDELYAVVCKLNAQGVVTWKNDGQRYVRLGCSARRREGVRWK